MTASNSTPDTSTYTLRSMHPSDAERVRALWHEQFGGNDETMTNWIDAVFKPRFRVVGTVAVAADDASIEDQTVVGFGMLDIASEAHTRNYLGFDDLGIDAEVADRNGILHMYCVDDAWKSRGIGTALYARHLDHLVDQKVPWAFGISWHRENHPDSRSLFEKFGFASLGSFDRFYARADERHNCPDCDGYCTCEGSIYALKLHVDAEG